MFSRDDYITIFKSIQEGFMNLLYAMQQFWQWMNSPLFTVGGLNLTPPNYSDGWNIGLVIIETIGWLFSSFAQTFLWMCSQVWMLVLGSGVQSLTVLELFLSSFVFIIVGWSLVKSFII